MSNSSEQHDEDKLRENLEYYFKGFDDARDELQHKERILYRWTVLALAIFFILLCIFFIYRMVCK